MTKGEALKKYGITFMSKIDMDEEADDEFIGFIAYLVENIFHDSEDG